jgi:phenylacetate-coenzyme A ligase PaaK-like adenylate-forming protein
MARFDDVVTDRRLTRSVAEEIITATGDTPRPAFGEFLVLTSGGSSGTRGIFVYDAAAIAEFVAVTMRQTAAMAAMFGPPPSDAVVVLLAAGSAIHATSVGRLIAAGGPVRSVSIPVTLPFAEVLARVQQLEPFAMLGYASVLMRLAAEQKRGRLNIHPVGITASAENLLPEMRAEIEEAFGVPMVDLYGSTEGLLGLSAPGDAAIAFASDCCIVEFVDENDQPVAPGATADAALVTNLYNLVQPLIRYRIDDRFTQQPPSLHHGHVRATVEGRASDVLRWGDTSVHPLAVTTVLTHTPAIVDFVVRQTPTGVDVDVVAIDTLDKVDLVERMASALQTAGLAAPTVEVREINETPRNPETGKIARIVPLRV